MLKLLRLIYFPLSIIIVSLIAIPLSLLRPRSYKNTGLYLRIFKLFSLPMGMKFHTSNYHLLEENLPGIVIGNHQHNFDIILASEIFYKRIVSLGKKELIYVPFFGLIFWLAGNIFVNRGNKKSSIKTMSKIKAYLLRYNLGIVIFPEGHRNPNHELLNFKKGAFITAIESQLPIIIFAVSQYTQKINLNKLRSVDIFINFLEPIPTKGLTSEDLPHLMEKCRILLSQEIERLNRNSLN